MLITNALAIVWLLNKQVGVLSLISELLNCSAEIWTIQDDTTCDCYLEGFLSVILICHAIVYCMIASYLIFVIA